MIFIVRVVPKNILHVPTDRSNLIWKVVNSLDKHTVQVNVVDGSAVDKPTGPTLMQAQDWLISPQIMTHFKEEIYLAHWTMS